MYFTYYLRQLMLCKNGGEYQFFDMAGIDKLLVLLYHISNYNYA